MTNSNLWGSAVFRRISLVLIVHSFCSWTLVAALPLVVAARFGAGTELIGSLALRLLPRILFAPIAATLLRRIGPHLPALVALTGIAAAIPGLAFAHELVTLQAIVFLIGLADTVVTPSLLTLRAAAIPGSRNMQANAAFQSIDRFAKIFGPPMAGLMVATTSLQALLFALALGHAVVAILLAFHRDSGKQSQKATTKPPPPFGTEAIATLRENPLLFALVVPALGYMISLGALQPFLFRLNRDQFHLGPEMWTVLLAAQGAGALLGAWVANRLAKVLVGTHALLLGYLVASLLEAATTFALILAPNHATATVLLIIGGIPEMVAFAAYFTLVQRCLGLERQAVFYALTLPAMDLCLAIGVLSAAMHSSGLMTLGQFWLFASACALLPVLPFLGRRRRHVGR